MMDNEWRCAELGADGYECAHLNEGPSLDDILYDVPQHCGGCGVLQEVDIRDVVPHIIDLVERMNRLEALMGVKCCEKDMGQGTVYVMRRYWCEKCKTEHLVDAQELSEYVQNVHREASNAATERLPDIL